MNWPLIPIKDLCDMAVDCINKTAPTVSHETPYKMIRTTNIKKGAIDIKEVKYVSKEVFEKWTRRSKPKFGDVILTREAPVGEVGRFTYQDCENIFLGQRLFHYRPNPLKLDWNFLAYSLQSESVQARLKSKAFGATVPHVKVGDAESLLIPCPPLKDQKKIGSTLSSYDDLISINQRRIALLEEAARRLYREWFVHLRFPGHESVPVQDGIPKGWTRGVAHDFISIMSGGTPKTKIDHYWGGEIPFFTPKDATNDFFARKTEKTLTNEGIKNCNSQLFQEGTIFITARGTVGKINMTQEPMAMNQSCYALKPKLSFDNHFLFMSINDAVSHFKQAATGGVFDAIIVDTFKTIPFTLPEPELTFTFGSKVLPIFDQIKNLIVTNDRLQLARDLLLPRLMSGKLDVSNIPLPEEVLA